MRGIVLAVAALMAAIAGWRVLGSFNWRMSCDAALMNYVGSQMLHGAVPYRDMLEMNMPGIYWLHETIVRWFGIGDWPMRAFDLVTVSLICAESYLLLRRSGGAVAALAIAGLVAAHISEGPNYAEERDFVMVAPLLGAALFSIWFLESGDARWLIPAGLSIGIATLIKPTGVLVPVALIPALTIGRKMPLRRAASIVWSLGLPIAAVLISAAVVLASEHALIPFLAAQRDFIPIYAKLHKSSVILRLPLIEWQIPFSAAAVIAILTAARLFPFLGLILAAAYLTDHDSPNRNLRLICFAYAVWAVASIFVQGKGYIYQADPLAMFLIIWGAAALGDLLSTRSALLYRTLAVPVALTLVVLVPVAWDPPRSGSSPLLADRIAGDLEQVAAPSDSVQVMDMVGAGGGIHALMLLGMHEPTHFIYDFPLMSNADLAAQRVARAEFLRELTANPPRAIVVTNQQWPDSHGYDRIDAWADFTALVRRSYGLRFDYSDPQSSDGYRIYVRNDDSPANPRLTVNSFR